MIAFGTNADTLVLQGAGRARFVDPECSRWKFGKVTMDGASMVEQG